VLLDANTCHRTTFFFQNVSAGAPMLHQANYIMSLRLPPHMSPPMCLQYIVLASGAATSPTHRHLAEAFYQRARIYAEADELKVLDHPLSRSYACKRNLLML
jgi:hypothetical protein